MRRHERVGHERRVHCGIDACGCIHGAGVYRGWVCRRRADCCERAGYIFDWEPGWVAYGRQNVDDRDGWRAAERRRRGAERGTARRGSVRREKCDRR